MRKKFFVIDKKRLFLLCCCVLTTVLILAIIAPLFMKATLVSASGKLCPIYRVDTKEKKVALTVNAAWEDTDTDAFLEVFDYYDVKVTFFVVGEFAQRCENAVVRIHNKGHEIGTHSDTHADMAKLDEAGILRELSRSSEKIEKITGIFPALFRAPSGSYNNEVVNLAQNAGFEVIQWDTDTVDWKGKSADEILQRVQKKVKNGSIILTHLGAENTKKALPKIIKWLLDEGYEIVTVSELIYPKENAFVDSRGEQHLKEE